MDHRGRVKKRIIRDPEVLEAFQNYRRQHRAPWLTDKVTEHLLRQSPFYKKRR